MSETKPVAEWMKNLANELVSDPKPTRYETILHIIAAHAPSPAEWRIMANAPKDGTHILVISDSNLIPTPVHWFDGGWHLSSNWDGNHSEYTWGRPTEWQPIPEVPR